MYLIPITVPIYKDDSGLKIATDWKRALELLRNSHGNKYGPIIVAAPWKYARESEQVLESVTLDNDDIDLIPVFSQEERLRSYWLNGIHKQVNKKISDIIPKVKMVHGTVEDSLRSFCYTALMQGVNAGIPAVFVQDQDVAATLRDSHKDDNLRLRLEAELQAIVHERHSRIAAASCGLSLLKGRGTVERYKPYAQRILQIEDTSYLSSEVISQGLVKERLSTLLQNTRPLRLAYCGRLVDIKGLDRSINIIHRAHELGANVTLEIIGGGPEEDSLKELADQLNISDKVTFLGPMPYDSSLLKRLGECDAMFFNPRMEETPRMIFDGYAAGLPLISDKIDYVIERSLADKAVIALPKNDDDAAVNKILELDHNRDLLVSYTEQALKAAIYHAADNWYARRALATQEMVEQHNRGK